MKQTLGCEVNVNGYAKGAKVERGSACDGIDDVSTAGDPSQSRLAHEGVTRAMHEVDRPMHMRRRISNIYNDQVEGE